MSGECDLCGEHAIDCMCFEKKKVYKRKVNSLLKGSNEDKKNFRELKKMEKDMDPYQILLLNIEVAIDEYTENCKNQMKKIS